MWFNDGTGDSAPVADGYKDITILLLNLQKRFKLAVDALSAFTAERDGAVVTVTNAALGISTHASKEGIIDPIAIAITQKGSKETPGNSVSRRRLFI